MTLILHILLLWAASFIALLIAWPRIAARMGPR